jgi:hypothetical protein
MDHSFDTVDDKLAETEFFLRKMAEAGMAMFDFNCYLSAFLSASRTCTLALRQFKDIPGFPEWYEPHRERLRASETAQFFLDARNLHVHGGPYPVAGASFSKGTAAYQFARSPETGHEPSEDVVTTCRDYFVALLEIVYDCYLELGLHIDPQQYYTKEHYPGGIDVAETQVYGWVRESLIEEGFDEDARWNELRGKVAECKINHLFFSYLGKSTPEPVMPEEYADFAYTAEEKGWLHTPAGFRSLEDYRLYVAMRSAAR